jgi:hypothetical protein
MRRAYMSGEVLVRACKMYLISSPPMHSLECTKYGIRNFNVTCLKNFLFYRTLCNNTYGKFCLNNSDREREEKIKMQSQLSSTQQPKGRGSQTPIAT